MADLDPIATWAADPDRGQVFVAHRTLSPGTTPTAPWPAWVPPRFVEGLGALGLEQPWDHQATALEAAGRGEHVVIASPTASGKSLVYSLPVLAALAQNPDARALMMFPTKALARDQAVAFNRLAEACGVNVLAEAYDGDTPRDLRRAIREGGRVVITNPDMLHTGLLPQHNRWRGLFAGLTHVVLDEVHTYRGIFGGHVANVLRRLRRVTDFHRADPRFVLCSATIANPGEHAERLIEAPVTEVVATPPPRGTRDIWIYNPPLVDGSRGLRGSYVQGARRVALTLHRAGVPTIVFANTRLNVERLVRHLKEDISKEGGDPESVSGYRGGYLPGHRRAVEAALREGRIRTVVSTSALELGIDIGQLGACVLAGYPGSIASALQRAGRAGRRAEGATVVLVARSEPVDQYIAQHPEFFFDRAPEHARLDADNLLILSDHLKCAAFELPVEHGEAFGRCPAETAAEILDFLVDHRVLFRGGRRYHWTGDNYPAAGVGLRRIAEGNYVVIDTTDPQSKAIGEVDFHAAPTTLYPQAIYSVAGRTWQITQLDQAGRRAEATPVEVDYYTDAHVQSGISVLDRFGVAQSPSVEAGHGEVRIFERVVGFKKIRFATGENVGYGEVNLPDAELHTTAFWLAPAPDLARAAGLSIAGLQDALAGLGRALGHVAAVHLMCDPADLGVEITHPDQGPDDHDAPSGPPVLFIYERTPGGTGLHEALFADRHALLTATIGLLDQCACTDGCPACVGAPATPEHPADQPRSRHRAADLARHLL